MKIRRAPIKDLLAFLEEEGDTFNKYENILECIRKHYQILTEQNILLTKYNIMNTLCFCDNGFIINNNFPYIDGILVRNSTDIYGIVFHGYKFRGAEYTQTEDLQVWIINELGLLEPKVFNIKEWEAWGALTSFYEYENYEEGLYCTVGSRDVKFGMIGRDVFTLQSTLINMGENISLTGEFDAKTLVGVQNMQKSLSLTPTGFIKKEEFGKIIR